MICSESISLLAPNILVYTKGLTLYIKAAYTYRKINRALGCEQKKPHFKTRIP